MSTSNKVKIYIEFVHTLEGKTHRIIEVPFNKEMPSYDKYLYLEMINNSPDVYRFWFVRDDGKVLSSADMGFEPNMRQFDKWIQAVINGQVKHEPPTSHRQSTF